MRKPHKPKGGTQEAVFQMCQERPAVLGSLLSSSDIWSKKGNNQLLIGTYTLGRSRTSTMKDLTVSTDESWDCCEVGALS